MKLAFGRLVLLFRALRRLANFRPETAMAARRTLHRPPGGAGFDVDILRRVIASCLLGLSLFLTLASQSWAEDAAGANEDATSEDAANKKSAPAGTPADAETESPDSEETASSAEVSAAPTNDRSEHRVPPANQDGPIYVIDIHETIEPGLAAFLGRALAKAAEERASAVILNVNTPGGRVDAALVMKDALVDSPVPTYAFIKRQAYSAGALIALAANEIWVSPGAVIGAATPVTGGGEKAPEKMVSAMRSAFAATAELRGRDPKLAEAMVDEDIVIEELAPKGKLLTLTAEQALARGYAEESAESIDALVKAKGLSPARVEKLEPSLAEHVARFFTNPLVAPLLMTLGMLGLLFEIKTAGWGVGGTVALVCLGLFFWGHTLAGLAGIEALILVVAGLILIALEVFVLPGFGVAGVAGGIALLAGFFLAITGDVSLAPPLLLLRAASMVSAALLLVAVGAWALLHYLPTSRRFEGLVLQSRLERDAKDPPPSLQTDAPSLLGARGVALTDLRPAGVARIEGRRIDVVSSGEYIPQGAQIEVIEDAGYRRVVQPISDNPPSLEEQTKERAS